MSEKFNFPTEVIDLPSKGLLYPENSLLASGKVEMKYMTAKEEDILTNVNYISTGIVIDKLIQSLVVSKINYDELLIGDKNAILIAARILGYGGEYAFEFRGKQYTVDLSTLENKPLQENLFVDRKNEFEFKLPFTDNIVTFKLLTHADEKKIEEEVEGARKVNKDASAESSTRLKHQIISINGDYTTKAIREFVDNGLLVRDARQLRNYMREISPDVDTKVKIDGGPEGGFEIPFGVQFFWPDAGI